MEFTYKKYTKEYKEQVIELMKFLWHFDRELWVPYFEWKFENNPYTDEPLAFIALDGNKVVAFRGYMVMPICVAGRTYLSAVLADTVTHEDYQRMGLFSGVTKYSIEHILLDKRYLVSFNSSSGGKTLNGHLKLGWKPMSEREHLFRFTMSGLINKVLKKDCVIPNVSVLKKQEKYILSDECISKDIVSIPYDYQAFSHSRDEKMYDWRFKNPKETYKFAYLYDKNGHLVSYIVFFRIAGSKWDIVDFNTTDNKKLKKLLDWALAKMKPLYVLLWTVGKNNDMYQSCMKYGFLPINKILNRVEKFKKPPFLIREFNDCEHESIVNSTKWNLFKLIADEI